MGTTYFLPFVIIFLFVNCSRKPLAEHIEKEPSNILHNSSAQNQLKKAGAALLLPDYRSLEELKSVVIISYNQDNSNSQEGSGRVTLQYNSRGREVISILEKGVDENDFQHARNGSFLDKIKLALSSPFTMLNKSDLERIEILSRRRDHIYGEGDIAFYDLAESMVKNISVEDKTCMDSVFLSEKGYLNTFNHVTAQTFMTAIFSEELADFVGDVHERSRLPELITGVFTKQQLDDLNDGPVDNYIDMLNDDWGQELGKILRKKYSLTKKSEWTPVLLADFLNDIQSYYGWVFQIGFEPFDTSDEIVTRFSNKINNVMEDISRLRKMK